MARSWPSWAFCSSSGRAGARPERKQPLTRQPVCEILKLAAQSPKAPLVWCDAEWPRSPEVHVQITCYIISFILIIMGADWLLQWLNVMSGSMSGENQSGLYGAVLIVAGLFLMLWTGRRNSV
jgi:hypothetical protein